MESSQKERDRFYGLKRKNKAERQRIKELQLGAKLQASRERQLRRNFGASSKVIHLLAQHSKSPLRCKRHSLVITLGKSFSIFNNPEEVISLITSIAYTLKTNKRIREITFHYAALEEYDLAANALLDLIAVERKMELRIRQCRKQLRPRGYYPRDPDVRRFIKSMGIIKHLDVVRELPDPEEAKKIKFFDARNLNYFESRDPTKADFKDIQLKNFADHVDNCLKAFGYMLSDEGKSSLLLYTGEVIGNAEEHAGFKDWTIQGYLDKSLAVPICEIAIFNLGKSIAESFESMKPGEGDYTWKHVGQYLLMHQAKKLFEPNWRREDLLTVMALQANVSTKNLDEKSSRGQGTVDMIGFFENVHKECDQSGNVAKMAILSGSTCIYFDGTYSLVPRENAGATIAFNPQNDLHLRPDPAYVKNLKNQHFPGTIISIKFPITLSSDFVEVIDHDSSTN